MQSEAVPLILGGGDVLMAAETGSGKTGAFCLPVLQITWESLKELQEGGGAKKKAKGSADASSSSSAPPSVTMSVHDRSPEMAVSPDGLRCQSRHFKEWHGCRASRGVAGRRARVYYEATVEDEGLCRVGFASTEVKVICCLLSILPSVLFSAPGFFGPGDLQVRLRLRRDREEVQQQAVR